MYRAEFAEYQGKFPFWEFLNSLTSDERAEVFASIDKLLELKNNNNRIPDKLSKFIRDGIFELRVKHLNKISRSFYFYEKNQRLIFTNGFIKKTDKIPPQEFEKALKIKKIYSSS